MNEYTVKEFAQRERVTQRTVYNWMAKGAVDFRRTPGGRIRIYEGEGSRVVILTLKDNENTGSVSA